MDEEGEQAGASTQQLCVFFARQVRFCPKLITRPHRHFRESHRQQAATVEDLGQTSEEKQVK